MTEKGQSQEAEHMEDGQVYSWQVEVETIGEKDGSFDNFMYLVRYQN